MRFIQTIACAALLAAAHAHAADLTIDIDDVKAAGAGYQSIKIPRQDGAAIQIDVWYPSRTPVAKQNMGVITQEVAMGGEVQGNELPLIVFSHGTGSFGLGHYDTALALANAGFVVAALTHPGDNHADQSRSVDVLARPKHIIEVIDYMLATWKGREVLAPSRIGIFGFSAGGFTALVNIGGMPDLSLVSKHCKTNPSDFACTLLSANKDQLQQIPRFATKDMHDVRIRAAVIAAPALGFAFSSGGLNDVDIPMQLWRAEDDVLLPHPWYAEAVRKSLRKEPDYHSVANAGHFDFLAPCSEKLLSLAPQICTSKDGFDRESFHRRFNSAVVAFFIKSLSPT
jgi:predicted dienelactone hydrolase